jgi:hypothetical protein
LKVSPSRLYRECGSMGAVSAEPPQATSLG